MKKCPDCAEMVLVEARKCRFCGFEFRSDDTTSGRLGYYLGGALLAFLLGLAFFAWFKQRPQATPAVTSQPAQATANQPVSQTAHGDAYRARALETLAGLEEWYRERWNEGKEKAGIEKTHRLLLAAKDAASSERDMRIQVALVEYRAALIFSYAAVKFSVLDRMASKSSSSPHDMDITKPIPSLKQMSEAKCFSIYDCEDYLHKARLAAYRILQEKPPSAVEYVSH
jgi:hypothetical protein